MSDIITEIKKLIKENKLIIGTERTTKGLRESTIEKVYLAKNCPDEVRDSVVRYAEINGAEVVDVGVSNEELGDICKKPFPISVLGLPKQG